MTDAERLSGGGTAADRMEAEPVRQQRVLDNLQWAHTQVYLHWDELSAPDRDAIERSSAFIATLPLRRAIADLMAVQP